MINIIIFGWVAFFLYHLIEKLNGMFGPLGLDTELNRLDPKTRRKIVKHATEYCVDVFGVNNRKKTDFAVSILKQDGGEPAYGQYCPYENRIYLYHNNCHTVKLLVRTLIHEYTHYLQPVKSKYHKLLDKYGYDNHPMEIEAREMEEEYYKDCWNYIKESL